MPKVEYDIKGNCRELTVRGTVEMKRKNWGSTVTSMVGFLNVTKKT